MKRALSEFHVAPIKTTIPLHLQIMDNPNFRRGDVDTGFVERSAPAEVVAHVAERLSARGPYAASLHPRWMAGYVILNGPP